MRALVELAAAGDGGRPVTAERLADAQGIPQKFLQNILLELRRAGIVASHRGPDGGHSLARPADAITVADVIRAVDGPLVSVTTMVWAMTGCTERAKPATKPLAAPVAISWRRVISA